MKNLCFVGLDVHKETICVAVAKGDGGKPEVLATLPHDVQKLLKLLRRQGAPESLRVCYEAGPTGFGLCRALKAAKIDCIVVAPSLVPTQSGDRIKTDRRDAVKLARFLRSGDLTAIFVPDEHTEAIRDLERARGDAKKAERVARQNLMAFLLRHERRFAGKSSWTQAHLKWIREQAFEQPAQKAVLDDYIKAVEMATQRVEDLTKQIGEMVEGWAQAPLVKALQALRGIQLITAVTIVAELGDLKRFGTAKELMSYLGLVPSEHSTGESTRRGRITRAGNGHVRRVLVESAWSYRSRARMSAAIRKRNEGVSEQVQGIAWKAQNRLHQRYTRLTGRGVSHQKVVTAVARELAGFVWAIGQRQKLVA